MTVSLRVSSKPTSVRGTPYYYFLEGLWNQRFSGRPRGQSIDLRDFTGKVFMVKQLTANGEQPTAMWLGIGTSFPWDRLKRKAASGLCRLQPWELLFVNPTS